MEENEVDLFGDDSDIFGKVDQSLVDVTTSDVQAPAGLRCRARETRGPPAKRFADEVALKILTSASGKSKNWQRLYNTSIDLQSTANPLHFALQAVQATQKHPRSLYLPEPNSFRAILGLPLELKFTWKESIRSELKNLIKTTRLSFLETTLSLVNK